MKMLGNCCGLCAENSTGRVTAIKRWEGWFAWNARPDLELVTTRYRKLRVVVQMTPTADFEGSSDWLQIDSTYAPRPGDVAFASVFWPCTGPDQQQVYAYNDSDGNPRNWRYWPGGETLERVYECEIKRREQGQAACSCAVTYEYCNSFTGGGWPPVPAVPENYPPRPVSTPSLIKIDESVVGRVVDVEDIHPGSQLCGEDFAPNCDLDCEGTVSDTWATTPSPNLVADGYDTTSACANVTKYWFDYLLGYIPGGNMVVTGTEVSEDGLTLTITGHAISGYPVVVTAILSESYTLAQAQADAYSLLNTVVMREGDTHLRCDGEELVWENENDWLVTEDWVCRGEATQPYTVQVSDLFLGTTVAQNLLYDALDTAYLIMTRTRRDWGENTAAFTRTPYTYPHNTETPTPGTPEIAAHTAFYSYWPLLGSWHLDTAYI